MDHAPRPTASGTATANAPLAQATPARHPAPLCFPDGQTLTLDRPRIMGVLNVTPDSFRDGGRFNTIDTAVTQGLALAQQGATLIDVGGESSRPGAARVEPGEQIARTAPVIAPLREALDNAGFAAVQISIDTTRAPVAEAALEAGAAMINDISAGREDPDLFRVAASHGTPVVLMHMHGQPRTMQHNPTYQDVVAQITAFLHERVAAAVKAGVSESQVVVDPGIGFGKTVAHNLAILRALPDLVRVGPPVLLGTSRKSFLAKLTGHPELRAEPDPAGGSAATTALGVRAGVRLFRVHDAELNRQAADTAFAWSQG
ncbi:MAG: dihydropteroate synthase [Planctomycetota bacterium]